MDNKSDGEKWGVKKKTSDRDKLKNRSYSVGSVDLTKNEINKIIGFENEQKISDKNYEDKMQVENMRINLDKNDINDSATFIGNKVLEQNKNVLEITENKIDDVFKPSASLTRTPPKETEKEEFNTQKRPRSETSPETQDRLKIHKSIENGTDEASNCHEYNLQEPQSQNLSNTEIMLQSIASALETMHNLSKSEVETKSIVSDIRTAAFRIHTAVTSLAYKVGQLEKENYILSQKI